MSRTPSKGAIQLLTEVYHEKGLAGWYQGLGAQIVKAVLCQGMSQSLISGSRGRGCVVRSRNWKKGEKLWICGMVKALIFKGYCLFPRINSRVLLG